jgi:hypothetical protein
MKADKESSKILSELAKKLGGIKDDQFEDLKLGMMMDSVKTGKTVSRSTIMNKLKSK